MAHSDIPPWFDNAVSEGLQVLVTLSLPGTPPAETISLTADVWTQTLWHSPIAWAEHLDGERVRRGFMVLARTIERWPAPLHLLKCMPDRQPAKQLPAPPPSREQLENSRRRVRAIIDMLAAAMKATHGRGREGGPE